MDLPRNTTISANIVTTSENTSFSRDNLTIYTDISDILYTLHFSVALFAFVAGCVVANIVRNLDNDQLRSRFSLLVVLISDIVLAFSNLTKFFGIFNLIDRKRYGFLECPLVYLNSILSAWFVASLSIALFCLAVDQVIAVFNPLYFRTTSVARRNKIYGAVICISLTLITVILIYFSLDSLENTNDTQICWPLVYSVDQASVYVMSLLAFLAITTPLVYAAIFLNISRQNHLRSENRVESFQNRKTLVTFFLLTASYIVFWVPEIAYFVVCFSDDLICWKKEAFDVSLIMEFFFSFNYLVDPVLCAIRMAPIRHRIRLMFSSA